MRISLLSKKIGFTLIELVIAISILAVLVIAGASYFSPERLRMRQVEATTQQIVSLLRSARSLALSGQTVDVGGTPQTPLGGYGLFFDYVNKRPFVFANITTDDDVASGGYNSAGGDVITSYGATLVNFVDVKLYDGAGTDVVDTTSGTADLQKDFWILFAPSSGEMTFGSGNPNMDSATKSVKIELSYGDFRKYEIRMNKISRFFEVKLTK